GAVAYFILHQIASGIPWEQASTQVYSGTGSKGNGGAMRAAVIGAYFFDDLSLVGQQSIKATQPTHAHPGSQAVAVAVGVGAALAVRVALKQCAPRSEAMFSQVIDYTPPGQIRLGLQRAAKLLDASPRHAGNQLGTGVQVLAEDTVPFAIWCALTTLHNYENA